MVVHTQNDNSYYGLEQFKKHKKNHHLKKRKRPWCGTTPHDNRIKRRRYNEDKTCHRCNRKGHFIKL